MIVDCQSGNKLTGLFRGEVLRHLQNGKLKVFVPGVYPSELKQSPESLPDAEMVVPLFGGNNMGNGVFSYPNVGAVVVCQFMNGDQNYPVVLGATQGASMAAAKYQEVANELVGDTGEVPSCIHMVQVGKTKLKMYEGGHVEVQVAGDKAGKIVIDKNGNVFVSCAGVFQVKAGDVKIASKRFEVAANDITMYASGQAVVQGNTVMANATGGSVFIKSKTSQCGKMI
jgi:hypothetical protein